MFVYKHTFIHFICGQIQLSRSCRTLIIIRIQLQRQGSLVVHPTDEEVSYVDRIYLMTKFVCSPDINYNHNRILHANYL